MNRRTFITTIGAGTAALAGCSNRPALSDVNADADEDEDEDADGGERVAEDEVPQAVREVRPLAKDFHSVVHGRYNDVSVWINQAGDMIAMEYMTEQTSAEGLQTELREIAELYANVVRDADHEPVTLSIIMDRIRAMAAPAPVEQYAAGELEREAFHETVEVTGIERTDS